MALAVAVLLGGAAVVTAAPDGPAGALPTPAAPFFKGVVAKTVKVGKPYHLAVKGKGYPVPTVHATSALPAGMTLTDLGNGRLSLAGTFTAPGTFPVTFEATNSQGTATETVTFTVTGTVSLAATCGVRTGTPTTTKLLVIFEENHGYSSIVGSSSAPVINGYLQACGSATAYQALTHPSLPNYLSVTSGVSYATSPWTSDCGPSGSCLTGAENVFHQLGASRWKSYAESMAANCSSSGVSGAGYMARHNPALYYTDLGSACATDDVPLGTPTSGALATDVATGALPTFATVTPNANNDMHDGTIAQGDSWLGSWLPVLVSGPDYQSGHLAIVVVWDEGSGSGNVPSTVACLAISPFVAKGATSSTPLTHYSLLKAAEDVAGVSELGGAATAGDLRSALGF